jgi:hypothetical protein
MADKSGVPHLTDFGSGREQASDEWAGRVLMLRVRR